MAEVYAKKSPFGEGDTVSIEAEVTYVGSRGEAVDMKLKTRYGSYFGSAYNDELTLVKRKPRPKPAPGTLVELKYGWRAIISDTDATTFVGQGRVEPGCYGWSELAKREDLKVIG